MSDKIESGEEFDKRAEFLSREYNRWYNVYNWAMLIFGAFGIAFAMIPESTNNIIKAIIAVGLVLSVCVLVFAGSLIHDSLEMARDIYKKRYEELTTVTITE